MHKQRPTTAKPQINQQEIKLMRDQDQPLFQEIGSCLANFTILTELGKGSYGTVYKVKSNINSQIYVLKKIDLTHLKTKQQSEALKEAQLLRKLNHPNIIRYFVSFIEGDSLCIIMEFAEGGDLQQVIRKHKDRQKLFQEESIWQMAKELAFAIQHIHDNNIIHRDIKSQNIFIAKSGQIKLGDLGVSKIFNSQLPLKGTRVGTPLYLSPELIQQLPYDFKVDTWAFGCVIYNLITLEPPFTGDNLISLGMNIVNSMPKELPQRYTTRLHQLVFKALEKIPTLRPNIKEIVKIYFPQEDEKIISIEPEQFLPRQRSTKELRPFSSNPAVKTDQIHVNEKLFKMENLIEKFSVADQIPPIPKKKKVKPKLPEDLPKVKSESKSEIRCEPTMGQSPPYQQPRQEMNQQIILEMPNNDELINNQKLNIMNQVRPYSAQAKRVINNYFHQQPKIISSKKETFINIHNFLNQQKPHESIDMQQIQQIQKSTRIRNKFTIFDLKKFSGVNDCSKDSNLLENQQCEQKLSEAKGMETKEMERMETKGMETKMDVKASNVHSQRDEQESYLPQSRQKDVRIKSALNFFQLDTVKFQQLPISLPIKKHANTSEQTTKFIKKYTLKDIQDF